MPVCVQRTGRRKILKNGFHSESDCLQFHLFYYFQHLLKEDLSMKFILFFPALSTLLDTHYGNSVKQDEKIVKEKELKMIESPCQYINTPRSVSKITTKISFPIYSKSHIFHTLSGIFKPHEILQTLSEILHVIQYAAPVPFNLLNIYRTLSGIFGEYFRAIDVNQPN